MSRVTKNPPKGPHVQVIISTWLKDSHGLYDYEAGEQAYRKQTHYIRGSCKLYKDNSKTDAIFDTNNKHVQSANQSLVVEVIGQKNKNQPQFKLKWHPKKQIEQPNSFYKTPYLVVRDLQKLGHEYPGYPLQPGNIIKLGRVQYMVIEAKNEQQTRTLRDTQHFQETNGIFQLNKQKNQINIKEGQNNCKVCLVNDETPQDPLISPCNCKGSCQVIHVGCLRQWINSKVKKQIKGIAQSYNFTKFECQICKFPFPQIVRFPNNKDVEMMTIQKPNRPYILLESLCNRQQTKEQRCLHLIATQPNTPIKIGRGHQCQIRITDISVSRKHAQITLNDGVFYITDTKAKFGTLIRLQQDIDITSKPIKVQFARTVFQFKLKNPADQNESDDTIE